jgi:hypothetical protein
MILPSQKSHVKDADAATPGIRLQSETTSAARQSAANRNHLSLANDIACMACSSHLGGSIGFEPPKSGQG